MKSCVRSLPKKLKPWVTALALAIVIASMSALAMAKGEIESIVTGEPQNFREVQPENRCAPGEGAAPRAPGTIFRGAAPDNPVDMKFVAALGTETILNLQEPGEIDPREFAGAEEYSITELLHPMRGMLINRAPEGGHDNDSIIDAVAELGDPDNFPIYVHCKHGDDRTGMIIAFHRVFHECWKPQDAKKEWKHIAGWWHDFWSFARFHYFDVVTGNPESALYQEFARKLKR